jgi:hypothetical protein
MTCRINRTRRLPMLRALLVACASLAALDAAAQDFNDDGARDTVIGVPYEGYYETGQGRGIPEAGAVDVVYGTKVGSPNVRSQHWTLASAGIPGLPEEGDHFGYAVAWGYFNDGPYEDLAIGIPGRNVDGVEDAGAIVIIHGSAQGLVASGPSLVKPPRFLWQGKYGVPGVPFHGDNFGFSLAAGEWWESGFSYLAIGAPGVTAGEAGGKGRGEVVVMYHLYEDKDDDPGINQLWNQVVGSPEPGDWFGYSLAAGQFGIGVPVSYALAIGIPGEDVDGAADAGAVEVLYVWNELSPRRLHWKDALLLTQSTFVETTQSGSLFGFSLAAGDLNGQGWSTFWDELVIGEPLRDVGSAHGAGAIHVIHTSKDYGGLDPAHVTTWTQGGSLPGTPEDGDLFGFALAIGSDNVLAVGAPGENSYAGSVHIIHGGPISLTAQGAQVLSDAPVYRHFGWTLDATADRLLVGAPASHDDGGAVRVYGRNAAGQYVSKGVLTQDSIFGVGERTEPGDGFGYSLGAGGLPRMTFKW